MYGFAALALKSLLVTCFVAVKKRAPVVWITHKTKLDGALCQLSEK